MKGNDNYLDLGNRSTTCIFQILILYTLNICNYICQLFLNKGKRRNKSACISRALKSWPYLCFIVMLPAALHQPPSAPVILISSLSSAHTTFSPALGFLRAVALLLLYHHQCRRSWNASHPSLLSGQPSRPRSGLISSHKTLPISFLCNGSMNYYL